jgi:hypothetical protein
MSRKPYEYFDFDENDVSGQFVRRIGFQNPEEPSR